ncbi:glycosyltransferase [Humidesulfovibrio mexicanus]|uniref:glycosyltransferase n=1 Tax=Humidesulfovibrio mexicanus TaxID=147047 RepID=UPI0015C5B817|nr:glycosyltransferase [Humidesulfovibrio mexicanus]
MSIIVCTFNRRYLLKLCLRDFALQMDGFEDRVEVIVVDNNSADGTEAFVRDFAAQHPWLRYVHEPKQGLSNARNRGAAEARGEYLCYIDDDGKPGKNYVRLLLHLLGKRAPDLMGGPVYPYYTTKRPSWFRDEFEIRQSARKSGFSRKCSISGSNFIIRKPLLESLGGFSPKFGMVGKKTRLGEEKAVLLAYRASTSSSEQKVFYSLDLVVYHHVPSEKMRLAYFIKRGFFSGVSLVNLKNERLGSAPGYVLECAKNLFWRLPKAVFKGRDAKPHPVLVLQAAALQVGKIAELLRRAWVGALPGRCSPTGRAQPFFCLVGPGASGSAQTSAALSSLADSGYAVETGLTPSLRPRAYAGLFVPGGVEVLRYLAMRPKADRLVTPEVSSVIKAFHRARRPILAPCMALPVVLEVLRHAAPAEPGLYPATSDPIRTIKGVNVVTTHRPLLDASDLELDDCFTAMLKTIRREHRR